MKKEIAKGKIIRYGLKSDAPLLGSFEHFKTPIRVNQYRIGFLTAAVHPVLGD